MLCLKFVINLRINLKQNYLSVKQIQEILESKKYKELLASAKYLVQLRGIKNFKWFTRGAHNLGPARLRSIEVWYDWAKAEGILE